jgi:hypothetical protein
MVSLTAATHKGMKVPKLYWWSRWDCKSAIEENRRKTAKLPSLLPLTDFSNVP